MARQTEARDVIRELDTLYHPYDLENGQVQPVARVAARFAAVWARLARLAEAADLPTRARAHLAKAQRLTTHWLASLAFFFATLEARVGALDLPPTVEAAVTTQLIPALYLERVAARSTNCANSHRRYQYSVSHPPPTPPRGPWSGVRPSTRCTPTTGCCRPSTAPWRSTDMAHPATLPLLLRPPTGQDS